MMSASWSFFVVNIVYLALVGIVLVNASMLPGKGGLVPLVIGVPTVVLGLASMVRRIRENRARRLEEVAPAIDDDVAPWRLAWPIIGWLVALAAMVVFLGFYISIPLFAVAYLKTTRQVGWLSAIVLAVVLWGTVYVGFEVMLQRSLFEGTFFGAILPLL